MMHKNNNKGFTLAELLIVVAIIAVLVAIAIPVFTTQLEKSREATDVANVRSAYAAVVTSWLTSPNATTMSISAQQKVDGWQTQPTPYLDIMDGASESHLPMPAWVNGNNYAIAIDSQGSVTVTVG